MDSTPSTAVDVFVHITGATESAAERILEAHSGNLQAAVNTFFNDREQLPQPRTIEAPDGSHWLEQNTPVEVPEYDPFTHPVWGRPAASFCAGDRAVVKPNIELNIQRQVVHAVETDDSSKLHEKKEDTPGDWCHHTMQSLMESKMENGSGSWMSSTDSGQLPLLRLEDDELARAVSLSLQTAEHEKVLRHHSSCFIFPQLEDSACDAIAANSCNVVKPERATLVSSPSSENEETQEQPLVRRRMNRLPDRIAEQSASFKVFQDAPVSLESEERSCTSSHAAAEERVVGDSDSGGWFQPEEWGGISAEEHDEAVMLEAAYGLGGTAYQPSTAGGLQEDISGRRGWLEHQVPSLSVVAQRRLREQQDDEYHASLAADREKEMRALQDAQSRQHLAEEVANAAKAEEHMEKEKEALHLQTAQELEMQLRAKKDSLPPEPEADEDAVVTILVRMPDGRRQGRRFRKFDTLQSVFDFIDVYSGFSPGTYRLVGQYPRRTFADGERDCSLHGAGLNGKQEALFLELM